MDKQTADYLFALQINRKKSDVHSPLFQSRLLAGFGGVCDNAGTKKTSYFCRRERSPFSRENVKQLLQTDNPAQPDFYMRQHIARCTLRPSLIVQALKVLARNVFRGGGGSPESNL